MATMGMSSGTNLGAGEVSDRYALKVRVADDQLIIVVFALAGISGALIFMILLSMHWI